MGDHRSLILLPLLAAPLAACIPASAPPHRAVAPAPTPAPTPGYAPLPPAERVTGGDIRPTWTLQPVVPNAQRVEASIHIVSRGQSIQEISEITGAGVEAIRIENASSTPFRLVPGQRLRIPSGLYHRVGAGETGIGIAQAYGVDWGEIVTLNALTEPYILRIDQRLKLPNAARAQTPQQVDIAARAAAFNLDIDDIATGSQPALAENRAPAAASAAPRGAVTTAIAPPAAFSGRFRWPLDGRVIAKFGPLAPGKVNDGINIAVAAGTPIHAAADGVVAYAGDQIGVYGGLILIDHGGGWVSAYGHAQQLDVRRGQAVKAGAVIGRAGATGQVQSPQLHFQLRRNRLPIDPLRQLPAR